MQYGGYLKINQMHQHTLVAIDLFLLFFLAVRPDFSYDA